MSRSREDWIDAALAAIADGGPGAVAVEPLASALGATKGSFYWHFARRDDLLVAALDRWAEQTDRIVADLEVTPLDPRDRLLALFERVFGSSVLGRVEVALMGQRDDPAVAPVLARVTGRRLAFLTDLWSAVGLGPAEARSRSLFLYATYLGHLQLQAMAPDVVASMAGPLGAYRAEVLTLLGVPTP